MSDTLEPRRAGVGVLHAELSALIAAHAPKWIEIPTVQTAGNVPLPPDAAEYVYELDNGFIALGFFTGERLGNVKRWCLKSDFDVSGTTPIVWHERTTTTKREWTAESVAACVGKHVVTMRQDATGRLWSSWNHDDISAEEIRYGFQKFGVLAYYVLPPCEVTP